MESGFRFRCLLQARGIDLMFNDTPVKVELEADGARKAVHFKSGRVLRHIDTVMYAIGRNANTSSLNLVHSTHYC